MKLELKHLAPYLPYGLKVDRTAETNNPQIIELTGGVISLFEDNYYLEFKPILRPLSDLTDEYVKDLFGDKYKSVRCMMYEGTLNLDTTDLNSINLLYYLPQINRLFENHFDVFGLIEKGLAIDINTLKQD